MVVKRLQDILANDAVLRERLEMQIVSCREANPDLHTNPVQTLDDLWPFLRRFLTMAPWEGMNVTEGMSIFRRIDQTMGYFYFLFGELETDPLIAEWIRLFNTAWGKWLDSKESWSAESLSLLSLDERFGLTTNRYESSSKWQSWNDFFSRSLAQSLSSPFPQSTILSPCDGMLMDAPIKTVTLGNVANLLGDSPYRSRLAEGEMWHIVLDVYDYHHFHSPISGVICELKTIVGNHMAGGYIVWDAAQHRYRYQQLGSIGFQMLETRGVMVIDSAEWGLVALIPVGVAQVNSVLWNKELCVGQTVAAGQNLGCFKCGGSDVIVLFEKKGKPVVKDGSYVQVGQVLM